MTMPSARLESSLRMPRALSVCVRRYLSVSSRVWKYSHYKYSISSVVVYMCVFCSSVYVCFYSCVFYLSTAMMAPRILLLSFIHSPCCLSVNHLILPLSLHHSRHGPRITPSQIFQNVFFIGRPCEESNFTVCDIFNLNFVARNGGALVPRVPRRGASERERVRERGRELCMCVCVSLVESRVSVE